jgi:DNA-binding GntR family transcriptional regulator
MTTQAARDGKGAAAVLNEMRQAILAGELNPGQRLVESDLSQRFGASRRMVHEAIILLENEGLAIRETNRGAWIRPVSRAEALEITEVRGLLEGLCAARAAVVASDAERAELAALGEAMKVAVRGGDVMGYSRLCQEIHLRIREISRHQSAIDVLTRLRFLSVRYQFSIALLPGRPSDGLKEHLAVVQAVNTGRADVAEKAMREHLLSVTDAIKQLPESLPPPHGV